MLDVVDLRLREQRPADPKSGHVATDFYDILADGAPVGEISLRLLETEYLRLYGGQVGYGVAPSIVATDMLRGRSVCCAHRACGRV